MCKRFIRTRPKLASRWHDIRTIQDQLHMSNLPESFEKKRQRNISAPHSAGNLLEVVSKELKM